MLRNIVSKSTTGTAMAAPLVVTSLRFSSETKKIIQQLRARTDAPILDCKKALTECGADDIEKCVEWLKKKGLASADKKVSRETTTGVVAVAVARDQQTGAALGAAAIQLCCETDFTSGNEKFLTLANALTVEAENLMAQNAWGPLQSAENFAAEFQSKLIQPLIASVGENIQVRRVVPLQNIKGSNLIGVYAHGSTNIAKNAGSMVAVSFLKTPIVTPRQQEIASDMAQTCIANYFVGDDVPIEKYSMLGYGDDETIASLSKKENVELCRFFMMTAADADAFKNVVDFKL